MLPFLKQKRQTGVLVKERKPDGIIQENHENDSEDDNGLLSASQDLIDAVHSKDAKRVKMALKAAFEICDSEPHEEGPHINEDDNSYDSQNQKAARGDK